MGKVIKGIGSVVGKVAPVAGLIPGVGPLAAGIAGGAGNLLAGKNVAKGALGGALGGFGGSILSGGAGAGPLAGIAGRIGRALPIGQKGGAPFDLGKIIGTGGAVADFIGSQQQRKSSQRYANAQIDLRNKLLSQILSSPSTGLPGPATAANNLQTGTGAS